MHVCALTPCTSGVVRGNCIPRQTPPPYLHCSWLDEAQLWLAVRQESNLAAEKLKAAMETSLREQEAEREHAEEATPPLTNLSEERLRKRFAGSAVLEGLDQLLPGSVLFRYVAAS